MKNQNLCLNEIKEEFIKFDNLNYYKPELKDKGTLGKLLKKGGFGALYEYEYLP